MKALMRNKTLLGLTAAGMVVFLMTQTAMAGRSRRGSDRAMRSARPAITTSPRHAPRDVGRSCRHYVRQRRSRDSRACEHYVPDRRRDYCPPLRHRGHREHYVPDRRRDCRPPLRHRGRIAPQRCRPVRRDRYVEITGCSCRIIIKVIIRL